MSYVNRVPVFARAGAGFSFRRSHVLSSKPRSLSGASAADQDHVNTKDRSRQRPCKTSIDFEQTEEGYKSKDSLELLRSLLVLKLCSYDFLVDKNTELLGLSKKLLGQKAFEQIMKMTFYGQFVAGEDHRAIRPLIQRNRAFGVGAVLDYSVEEDISQAENKETDSYVSAAEKQRVGVDQRERTLRGRQRGGVTGARYAEEAKCDQHMENFLKCIRASGGSSVDGFSAIKMTVLGRPHFLLLFSEVLVKWQHFFSFLAKQQEKESLEPLEQKLDLRLIQGCLTRLGARGDIHGWFTRGPLASSRTVDLLDWNSLIDDRSKSSELLVVPNLETGQLEPLLSKFTEEEEEEMKRMLQRIDVLAKHAQQHGVRLMVDAEQSYLQPAISRLTLETQRTFNTHTTLVFNTYQCYLKVRRDLHTLRRDLHIPSSSRRGETYTP